MEHTPDGSIVISSKEFYDQMQRDIADIKQALAPLSPIRREVDQLQSRINALEAKVWRASGFAAAVGLAASYFIPMIVKG